MIQDLTVGLLLLHCCCCCSLMLLCSPAAAAATAHRHWLLRLLLLSLPPRPPAAWHLQDRNILVSSDGPDGSLQLLFANPAMAAPIALLQDASE